MILRNKRITRYVNRWNSHQLSRKTKQLNSFGLNLEIQPFIFDPDPEVTYSTTLLIESITNLEGKIVLDLGTGSGVIGLFAAKNGAKFVVGTDIDHRMVKQAYNNAELNGLTEKTLYLKSDLFENFKKKFDLIYVNLPILEENSYQTHLRLLQSFKDYLKDDGTMIMCYAEFGDDRINEELIKQYGSIKKILHKTRFDIKWSTYHIQPNQ